jgi:Mg/Co/Ni transporter MgtE
MIFKQKFYYLTKTPLSAEGPEDVEIINRADDSNQFPELFQEYENLRSHAFNEDNLYSVVRADEIFDLVRTGTEKEARELAFENAEPEIVTNLQHRVVQKNDKNARAILKEIHQIES